MDITGKWSFITIRFHLSDVSHQDHFIKHIFLPYISSNKYYVMGEEHPDTSERHIHAVIRHELRDNDKVRSKIKTWLNSKKINLTNTLVDHALDVKSVDQKIRFKSNKDLDYDPKYANIYCAIGYIVKQSFTKITTNMKDDVLEDSRAAYYHETKIPIAIVDNIYEHKQVSKGNLLNYMYDAHIKHPDVPIHCLEEFMIKHMNISFSNVATSVKLQVKKELIIIGEKDPLYYQKYKNDDISLMYGRELTFPKDLEKMTKVDLAILLKKEIEKNRKIENFLSRENIHYSEYMSSGGIDDEELEKSINLNG